MSACPGPLVWFHVWNDEGEPDAGILECNVCDYVIVTSNFNDERHSGTPMLASAL